MSDSSDRVPGAPSTSFIHEIIDRDLAEDQNENRVMTRFPPEPNGYLHIGHAKSIVLNFGIAQTYEGACNLRFDDTNPEAEETEYVESIKQDVRWLGYDWDGREHFASDYFERLYEFAVHLVEDGKAYVDDQSLDQIRANRGNFYKPGQESPHRERSVEENLDLLERMKEGEFDEGSRVLRAKIDMAHPNLNMRDPLIYRIRNKTHHRTGDRWHIYPMYDFAHGLSDAIEGVTHSICTLEFEDHRILYDWFIDQLRALPTGARPKQIEFARLNLGYTVLSKRKLQILVQGGHVAGWDDPRMPTLSGLRRRGFTPASIRRFCERIGVARRDSVVDVSLFEHTVREDLNARCPRAMGVLKPLRVVIENYPEGESEQFDAPYHPEDASFGSRKVPFSRVLYVEQDDFREQAPKKWFRLAPGKEVRLRYAALITCKEVIKNESGEVVELRCTWDPESRGGSAPDGRKVRGTLHWVSAEHAMPAEVRLYERLFERENPSAVEEDGGSFLDCLNPGSLEVLPQAMLEPALGQAEPETRWQLERLGYFYVDPKDSQPGKPVFNRTITLKDTWAKIEKKGG